MSEILTASSSVYGGLTAPLRVPPSGSEYNYDLPFSATAASELVLQAWRLSEPVSTHTWAGDAASPADVPFEVSASLAYRDGKTSGAFNLLKFRLDVDGADEAAKNALVAPWGLRVLRHTPATQTVAPVPNADHAANLANMVDKLTRKVSDLQERLDRAVSLDPRNLTVAPSMRGLSAPATVPPLGPSDRGTIYLTLDSTGAPVVSLSPDRFKSVPWDKDTAYLAGDIVPYGGGIYMARYAVGPVAGTESSPDRDPVNWFQMISRQDSSSHLAPPIQVASEEALRDATKSSAPAFSQVIVTADITLSAAVDIGAYGLHLSTGENISINATSARLNILGDGFRAPFLKTTATGSVAHLSVATGIQAMVDVWEYTTTAADTPATTPDGSGYPYNLTVLSSRAVA